MDYCKHISDAMGTRADKPFKATLFDGQHLFLGVNVLEPGQSQSPHSHAHQDKFCLVYAGRGHFEVGGSSIEARPGDVVFMPRGVPHGVENRSHEQLVLLMGLSAATQQH
jgi:quercetin dioxygenase-like cupin family protein